MANRNTKGFGLIPVGTIGSTPSTQGQGKYIIQAAYNADLFQGSVVKSTAGYLTSGQLAVTTKSIGVLNGIFYNAATTLKPTWANWYNQPITPANSENITCFVVDNPFQLFTCATNLVLAQAGYGRTYGVTVTAAGSETSGQSSSELLTATAASDTANQWRLLRTAEDEENNDKTTGYCSVVVCQNLNQYLTNAVTWQ